MGAFPIAGKTADLVLDKIYQPKDVILNLWGLVWKLE